LFEKALDFFEEISFKANEIVYTLVYKICASLCNERAIQLGKKSSNQMPKMFFNDIILVNSILHMFMKFHQVENAELIFKEMNKFTLYTYGIMINGYKINNQPDKCLTLFEQMKKKNIIINEPIALALVGACSQIGIRSISENISHNISHFQHDIQLKTSLIDMWVCIIVSFTLIFSLFFRVNLVILIVRKRYFNQFINLMFSPIIV
jgi:pentatricopeptide repeat protein